MSGGTCGRACAPIAPALWRCLCARCSTCTAHTGSTRALAPKARTAAVPLGHLGLRRGQRAQRNVKHIHHTRGRVIKHADELLLPARARACGARPSAHQLISSISSREPKICAELRAACSVQRAAAHAPGRQGGGHCGRRDLLQRQLRCCCSAVAGTRGGGGGSGHERRQPYMQGPPAGGGGGCSGFMLHHILLRRCRPVRGSASVRGCWRPRTRTSPSAACCCGCARPA